MRDETEGLTPPPRWTPAQEETALSKAKDKLEAAIIDLNEGRNLKCWPLCSFGWKDADIEATGCTGIDGIERIDFNNVLLGIGGHKMLGPDEEWTEDEAEAADRRLQTDSARWNGGYDIEWSGDEWVVSFMATVEVPWKLTSGRTRAQILNQEDEVDFEATARAVVEACRKECDVFENDMSVASSVFYGDNKEDDS
jgi:hypothetical protein